MKNEITIQKDYLNLNELEALNDMQECNVPFILAKNSIKIKEMDAEEAKKAIFICIAQAIELSGQNKQFGNDPVVIANVSKFVYEHLLEHFKGICLAEIDKSFKMGITGEFGDYIGFGVATFTKFIKGYMTSKKREAAMKEFLRVQEKPLTTEIPVAKLFEINIGIAEEFFSIFDSNIKYKTIVTIENSVFHLPSIYDFLHENYKFYLMPDEREGVILSAKTEYNNYLKKSDIKQINRAGFELLCESVKNETNRTYDNYLKAEALKFLFNKMKVKGITINNLKPNNNEGN